MEVIIFQEILFIYAENVAQIMIVFYLYMYKINFVCLICTTTTENTKISGVFGTTPY